MVTRLRSRSAAALLGCLVAVTAYAQEPSAPSPAPAPPNLAYVDGTVDVVQDGVTEPADPPTMLLDGDIVRTRRGRVEIVFGDGSLLHLSDETELEVLGPEHLRLVSGRAILRSSHSAARPYVIDTPASSVRLDPQGEYVITADRAARLEVAVARGAATVQDTSPWTIRDGQMLQMSGGRPLIQPFNSARWDDFAQWSYERANGFATSYSATQLPYELRSYGPMLDSYGWDHVAPYGSVWFPSVAAGWRPYYDGSWSFTRLGWTWYGRDRWAWPTHHYGRWGFNGNFWFWIPARVWAPAWVSWGYTSGYVGWPPLGWDNRPSIGLWGRRDYSSYWPDYTPWRAWTVVPRNRFVPRRNIRADAIDGSRLDDDTRRALAQAVPVLPGNDVAVPRDSVFGADRPGNVRRPQRSYPSPYPSNVVADPVGRDATPLGPADVPAATSRSRRPVDSPAYAPPRSGNSGDERRGITRDPGRRAAPQDDGSGVPPQAVPRNRPQGAPPPPESRGAGPQQAPERSGGASDRGGASRRAPPRAAAPSPAGEPPQSAPPSAQGGARRKPGL
jgi:Family of unknown function (DUF6600)/FecR protein